MQSDASGMFFLRVILLQPRMLLLQSEQVLCIPESHLCSQNFSSPFSWLNLVKTQLKVQLTVKFVRILMTFLNCLLDSSITLEKSDAALIPMPLDVTCFSLWKPQSLKFQNDRSCFIEIQFTYYKICQFSVYNQVSFDTYIVI